MFEPLTYKEYTIMKKRNKSRLVLSRETLHEMLSEELQEIAAGGNSCGGASACDCSGQAPGSISNAVCTNQGTRICTLMQY
jgi:hypothetical protein